ncbi:uncharacterized protein LOC126785649 isoform X4 [Argentina anserina]|uniref:uncharacterized protein LOC126785649 isoform X2 n=1 Tax=Argentina anserina TaxID=57926 RepID=UPI002176283C|nr:uncharacterized protein LOC126785649 isoform X2 [Potentilla anserina]XP_050367215.1 uncharacterized protein LOC126785649 isoform X4 [Potentilla anserina]
MATPAYRDDLHTILSEQRHELMAAKTLDSDLDIAFSLQMQEAMSASLSHHPSSSSRPPPPPPLPLHDDTLDLSAALMLEDIEKFAQEYEDHERSLLEVRKAKEDLDRRIHDQNFAAEVRDAPEDYWSEYGDNYEKPYYADGGGSSSAAVESECLRLYCKGLVGEEVVRDSKVVVAGAGVAICDPRDNLIFEARKILEAFDGGVVMSNEAVEIEALIEGLNTALSLELRNVTFFCDGYMLYQYVTGRVVPGNSKMATLVNQLGLLRRKFEYCSPSLVARSDIKFAFQFAREAIVSQITWPAETSNGKSLKETCVICFEDTDVGKMFSIDGCLHRYCFTCMKQHVEVKLLNGQMAQCPHEGCKSEVNIESCAQFLAPKLVEVMSQRIKESSIPVTEKVYCPNPRCSALMSKQEVLQYTNSYYAGAEQSGARRCMKCHSYFCFNCKVPWHSNMTCYDYKRSHPYPRSEDQLLKSLATKKRWRQCVMCKNMVELAEGCYHITCRCGYEFCYTCGAEWDNKKPTCSCPIWDLRNIIREQPQQVLPIIREQPRQAPQQVQRPIRREHQRQGQPIGHHQPQRFQVQQPIIPQQVPYVIHEQPHQGHVRVQLQPNIQQQQRQPVVHEQPRQAQPIRREQPRQVRQQLGYNYFERPRQAQPIRREQPRQVRQQLGYNYFERPRQAQPIRREQPRQVRQQQGYNYYEPPRQAQPIRREQPRQVRHEEPRQMHQHQDYDYYEQPGQVPPQDDYDDYDYYD